MAGEGEKDSSSDETDSAYTEKRIAAKRELLERCRAALERKLGEKGKHSDSDDGDKGAWGEVSGAAFPGRTAEEIAPIGLIYAGVRWGRDFRFPDIPPDEEGNPITSCTSGTESYRTYLSWLSDYLQQIEAAESGEEQVGLCRYVESMKAEDAMLAIGMDGAIYDWETEGTWMCIEEHGEDVESFLSRLDPESYREEDPLDLEFERERFLQVQREVEQWKAGDQGGRHGDIGYRLVLAKALAPIREKERRVELLDAFYRAWSSYAAK
ncbi:MAG: hypothetical protein P1U58_14270 [Verrucomicrobiales bacterium]|nr:hypothetical protein [Verrucomicrobiales bacterium]